MDALIQLSGRSGSAARRYAQVRKSGGAAGAHERIRTRTSSTRRPEPVKRGKVYEYDQRAGGSGHRHAGDAGSPGQAETPPPPRAFDGASSKREPYPVEQKAKEIVER
ncbi:MAG: hypothetical protein ACLU38_09095 [Dysosmobacter sp.]